MKSFTKDPDAVLDYTFDWKALTNLTGTEDYLVLGETISSFTVAADSGLTVNSSALAFTNTAVVVWLAGGTAGERYKLRCRIVTSANRTDDRTILVNVRDL